MKKKRIIVLVLQLMLVGVSIFLMLNYVNNRVKPVEVYVYNSDFKDSNRQIKASDVTKMQIPAEAVTNDFVFKEEDIVGKFIDGKVNKGQYAYKDQLIEIENIDVFNEVDLSKLRKISLPISYQEAFAGEIKRGDTLDLLYVGKGTAPNDENSVGGAFTYSKIFMSDVLVYSVTSKDGYDYVPHNEVTSDEEIVGDLGIVTLAVSLEDAEQIQARLNTGNIKFVGRFDESKNYNTLGYVMGEYGKVFSGKAFAETDELEIVEDEFQEVIIEEAK